MYEKHAHGRAFLLGIQVGKDPSGQRFQPLRPGTSDRLTCYLEVVPRWSNEGFEAIFLSAGNP